VEQAHGQVIGIHILYRAIDLSTDAADAIREGRTTFVSNVETTD
jgi:hypothetical protein